MPEKTAGGGSGEPTVPDSLVGSAGEFQRSKGIHLLPTVSADPDVLPPPAAIVAQPPVQDSTPVQPSPPPPPPSAEND